MQFSIVGKSENDAGFKIMPKLHGGHLLLLKATFSKFFFLVNWRG